jgi:hypothetical protein
MRSLGSALLCFGFALPALAADWPQWRGPNRDDKTVEPGLEMNWETKPPQHLWTMEGLGSGYASVSIVGNRLYTTGNFPDGQSVMCIDLGSHQQVWRTPLTQQPPQHDYPGSRCTPTVDGDRLYVVTSDGQIACLNRESGQVQWQKNFKQDWRGSLMSNWGYAESPLVDGDRVLCTPGDKDAMVVALDKLTGKEIWRTPVPYQGDRGKDGAGYSSIVISNAAGVKQYVQLVGHGLIGIRADDGKLLWGYDKVANGVANIPTPICTGDFVFASTSYQTGSCLLKLSKSRDGIKAEEKYFIDPKVFNNHHGGMILDGDFIYAGHQQNKGFPICVHLPTGKVRWGGEIRPPGDGSAAVTEVNHQLIFRYDNGVVALIAANPKSYQLQGKFTPEYQEGKSWAHPVVLDRKLYLREQDKLMCYQL